MYNYVTNDINFKWGHGKDRTSSLEGSSFSFPKGERVGGGGGGGGAFLPAPLRQTLCKHHYVASKTFCSDVP